MNRMLLRRTFEIHLFQLNSVQVQNFPFYWPLVPFVVAIGIVTSAWYANDGWLNRLTTVILEAALGMRPPKWSKTVYKS